MSEETGAQDGAAAENEPGGEGEIAPPMNRAERRAAAKNKGSAAHQQFGHSGGGSRPQVGRPVGGAGQVKMPRRTGGA